MTVRINKPALNLREELTKAQSVVPYVQQQFWMDGLVENGTFDTGTTNWDLLFNATASVVNGELEVTTTSGYGNVSQNIKTTIGNRYLVLGTVRAGTVNPRIEVYMANGGGTGVTSTSTTNQDLSFIFTSTTETVNLQLKGQSSSTGTAYFDNVRLFEVDENDNVIHSLPLGWKPLHVYEDGLIQREGDVHDYTVVKTGGAYAIKPAVQPTATTETCVIAEREL